jgi:two-component system, NtrC family, response regulator AtoC
LGFSLVKKENKRVLRRNFSFRLFFSPDTPLDRMARILIIDDDPAMVQVVADLCKEDGHTPISYASGQKALDFMLGHSPQLILTDLRMNGVNGMDILRAARLTLPGIPVILLTGSRQLESALEAMRSGAFDYILKPFNVEDLRLAVRRALAVCSEPVGSQNESVTAPLPAVDRFDRIVGKAPRMKELFGLIDKVASTDSTILIAGESGTGKELVARALHFNSARQSKPFVAVNCSALPENLLESELFGHKKGAFTGAGQDKIGLFEEAEGGTIFLDEINSMAPLLQTKLLRVLQERILRRVGDNRSIPIHVRVLAATNEPLFEKTRTGAFREDLYYRLAVIPLEVPPLRERVEDIPLLVEHFLQKHYRPLTAGQPVRIEPPAAAALHKYFWPGNVRELENAVERACALCEDGVIRVSDLPPHVVRCVPPGNLKPMGAGMSRGPLPRAGKAAVVSAGPDPAESAFPVGASLADFIAEQERRFIEETIRQNDGARDRAAQVLGISTATLYRKMDAAGKRPKRRGA